MQTTTAVTLHQIREGRIAYSALSHASPDNPLGTPTATASTEEPCQAKKGRTGAGAKKRHNAAQKKAWREKQRKGADEETSPSRSASIASDAPPSATTTDPLRQAKNGRTGVESSRRYKIESVSAWEEKHGKGAAERGCIVKMETISSLSDAPPSSAAIQDTPRPKKRSRPGIEAKKRHDRARGKVWKAKQRSGGVGRSMGNDGKPVGRETCEDDVRISSDREEGEVTDMISGQSDVEY
jgi:hypothetical protein